MLIALWKQNVIFLLNLYYSIPVNFGTVISVMKAMASSDLAWVIYLVGIAHSLPI